jgi:hypothetical protein
MRRPAVFYKMTNYFGMGSMKVGVTLSRNKLLFGRKNVRTNTMPHYNLTFWRRHKLFVNIRFREINCPFIGSLYFNVCDFCII